MPEEGWSEFRTTAFIIETLRSYGYEVLTGKKVINPDNCLGRSQKVVDAGIAYAREHGVSEELLAEMDGLTGCVGVLDTGRPGPTLAVRFDIDCVPVTESTDADHIPAKEGFASTRPGLMHACGHDAHTSTGLALAHWVADHKDELKGRFKILFQPAEEGVRGAAGMAASGIVDDADYFLAAHVAMMCKSGEVSIRPYGFLCTTKLDYRFRGTPSHAGMQPEVGRNALMAAAGAAMSLMALPRHGEGMTRVNVGYLRAGEGRNVIASTAEMQVEVRGETAKINTYMYEEAKARVQGAAAMYGVSVEEEVMGEAVDFVPDLPLRDAAAEVAKNAPYVDKVQTTMNFNGSDDATVLIKRVQEKGGQGAYLVVGSDLAAGHHQSAFDFEEKHLLTLFTIYRDLILRHLGAH